jgi:hypothetical protein
MGPVVNPHQSVPAAILKLGHSRVECARHPADPNILLHRPRTLSPDLSVALATCKPALLQLLATNFAPTPDAADIFTERLAVADGLEMPTHPGSPAWLVAVGEALAHDPSWAVPADPFNKAAADAGVPPCGQALVAHALRLFPGSSVAHVQRLRPGQSAKEFL